jgi:hypothetical protein
VDQPNTDVIRHPGHPRSQDPEPPASTASASRGSSRFPADHSGESRLPSHCVAAARKSGVARFRVAADKNQRQSFTTSPGPDGATRSGNGGLEPPGDSHGSAAQRRGITHVALAPARSWRADVDESLRRRSGRTDEVGITTSVPSPPIRPRVSRRKRLRGSHGLGSVSNVKEQVRGGGKLDRDYAGRHPPPRGPGPLGYHRHCPYASRRLGATTAFSAR